MFALAITASVPLVGVYLVFTSLVVPALLWRRLASRSGWWRGWLLGVVAYLLGLALSLWWDWPSGATVVWALALLALLVASLRRLTNREK